MDEFIFQRNHDFLLPSAASKITSFHPFSMTAARIDKRSVTIHVLPSGIKMHRFIDTGIGRIARTAIMLFSGDRILRVDKCTLHMYVYASYGVDNIFKSGKIDN